MCLKRVEKYIRCAIIYHISECFICDGEAMDIAFVIFFIVKKFRRETVFRGGYKRIILLITQVLRSI